MGFTINLTQVLIFIITLIFGVITKHFIPLIKARTNERTYNLLLCICNTAVHFAEQWYKMDDGEIKKQHALEYVMAELDKRNITVDTQLISDCIESEVNKLKIELKNKEQGE